MRARGRPRGSQAQKSGEGPPRLVRLTSQTHLEASGYMYIQYFHRQDNPKSTLNALNIFKPRQVDPPKLKAKVLFRSCNAFCQLPVAEGSSTCFEPAMSMEPPNLGPFMRILSPQCLFKSSSLTRLRLRCRVYRDLRPRLPGPRMVHFARGIPCQCRLRDPIPSRQRANILLIGEHFLRSVRRCGHSNLVHEYREWRRDNRGLTICS